MKLTEQPFSTQGAAQKVASSEGLIRGVHYSIKRNGLDYFIVMKKPGATTAKNSL